MPSFTGSYQATSQPGMHVHVQADGVQSAPRMLSPPPFPNLADQPAGQQAGYPAAPVHQARDDVSSGTAAPKHAGAAGAGTAAGGGSTVVAGLELSRALQKQLEALQSAHARLQA